ncbi:MAG: metallophosphoesterase family protein [Candidatus Woesearchaeota archaeon]
MLLEKILEFFGIRKAERFAVISDIHSNLEALSVVINDIKENKISNIYCCGDIVGYGPNPNECVEIIKNNKITSVKGNHDYAVINNNDKVLSWFNSTARDSIIWTNRELNEKNKDFLKKIPDYFKNNMISIVHGSLNEPIFEYVYPNNLSFIFEEAEKLENKILFLGHTHYPFLFAKNKDNSFLLYYYKIKREGEKIIREPEKISENYRPYCIVRSEIPSKITETIIIKEYEKVIVNVGSVGQPRDYDNRACYVICEFQNSLNKNNPYPELRISFVRIKYDYDRTKEKILKSGLPEKNAYRLELGK